MAGGIRRGCRTAYLVGIGGFDEGGGDLFDGVASGDFGDSLVACLAVRAVELGFLESFLGFAGVDRLAFWRFASLASVWCLAHQRLLDRAVE